MTHAATQPRLRIRPPRYTALFRPVNGRRPDFIKIRLALKRILREEDLRCLEVREIQPPAGPAKE